MVFDSRFTFEHHLRSVSSSVAQKIGVLRESSKVFGDQSILLKCFNSYILPCLEYCSPVWCSAADSHFRLLDKNLNVIIFLITGLSVDLCAWFLKSVVILSILFTLIYVVCFFLFRLLEVLLVLTTLLFLL